MQPLNTKHILMYMSLLDGVLSISKRLSRNSQRANRLSILHHNFMQPYRPIQCGPGFIIIPPQFLLQKKENVVKKKVEKINIKPILCVSDALITPTSHPIERARSKTGPLPIC